MFVCVFVTVRRFPSRTHQIINKNFLGKFTLATVFTLPSKSFNKRWKIKKAKLISLKKNKNGQLSFLLNQRDKRDSDK